MSAFAVYLRTRPAHEGVGLAEDMASFISRATTRGERAVSSLRGGFCAVVCVRFLVIHDASAAPAGAAWNLAVLTLGMALSLWTWFHLRRVDASNALAACSALADVLICGGSLLQTVLWPPSPHAYPGLLAMPDAMALVLVVCASSFRLSPKISLVSGAASLVLFLGLLQIERARYGAHAYRDPASETFYLLLIVSATALATTWSSWSLRLARAAALDAARIERARLRLDGIARAHHDTRTLLSTVALQLDLWLDGVGASDGMSGAAAERGIQLKEQVRSLSRHIQEVARGAFDGSTLLQQEQVVDTLEVLPTLIAILRHRYPTLRLEAALEQLPRARLIGGRVSLERILANLVQNALEGDGSRGAATVFLRAHVAHGFLVLAVRDDGPGLPVGIPKVFGETALSSKREGTGLGLHGIAQLLEASGGRLRAREVAGCGALLELQLRLSGS